MIHVESLSPQTIEDEKHELRTLFESGLLSRAPNLHRFLEYVCDCYFTGQHEGLKEYSIAVNALNRSSDFNPQSDTIVRVTARALRKRLDQYYAGEGASHLIHIALPPGQYVPKFYRPLLPSAEHQVPHVADHVKGREVSRRTLLLIIAAVLLLTFGGQYGIHRYRTRSALMALSHAAPLAGAYESKAIRFLPGATRSSLVDASGHTWSEDKFCQGGKSFARADHSIQGADDERLFNAGREGKFRCEIPADRSTDYELHLLFADTTGEHVASRQVVFYLNNGPAEMFDVVDEAGGNDIATGRVYPGVHAASDGLIHLNFTADGSFVNAIELVPSPTREMLPLRIVPGPGTMRDENGNIWQPERYFSGGRTSYHPDKPNAHDPPFHRWERFGHFRYSLPVLPGRQYSVTLFFSEGWFGAGNWGSGGVGSRIFDVYCNGTTLLKNFDILSDQPGGVSVKTFHHVAPTAQGKLEFSFEPVVNYPLVNAIEIDPEPAE